MITRRIAATRVFLAAAVIGAARQISTQTPAVAQNQVWPSRPVKIIVPVAAGTATDLTARVYAEKLGAYWGQPVIVENRPGADGLIAIGGFVQSRDDHSLLFSFSTAVSLNPLIHAKLPYDPNVDLVPLATTTEVIFAIAASASLNVSTLGEFVQAVKAAPGKYNWAAAPGLPRFVFEGFRKGASLDIAYVSYNQTGSAAIDLAEGRIQAAIAAISTIKPAIDSGKARFLAVTSNDRAAMLPDVQSAIEAGFPDLVVPALGCVFGQKDLAQAARDRIFRDVDNVSQEKDVIERFGKIGQAVRRTTTAELAQLLADQKVQLAPIAAALGGK